MKFTIKQQQWCREFFCILTMQAEQSLAFEAGQYLEFLLPSGLRLHFSIGNAPNPENLFKFYIRFDPHDKGLSELDTLIKNRQPIEVSDPQGVCVYRNDNIRNVVLLTHGTGYGQSRAILEAAKKADDRRSFYCYWSGGDGMEDDFFDDNNMLRPLHFKFSCFCDRMEGARFPTPKEHAALIFNDDFSNCVFYITGSWAFVDETLPFLLARKANRSYIYSDRFAFS